MSAIKPADPADRPAQELGRGIRSEPFDELCVSRRPEAVGRVIAASTRRLGQIPSGRGTVTAQPSQHERFVVTVPQSGLMGVGEVSCWLRVLAIYGLAAFLTERSRSSQTADLGLPGSLK